MKVTADRDNIVAALDRVRRVTPAAKSNAGSPNARLLASEGRLTIFGSDLTVFVACRVPADVAAEGEIGVVPSDLSEMIRRMPEGAKVTLAASEGRVAISAEGVKRAFRLPYVEAADLPAHRGVSPVPPGTPTIAGDALATCLKRVVVAAYGGGDRPHMQGVAFDGRDMAMTITATDGIRVSETELDGAGGDGSPPRLLHTAAARVVAAEAAAMGNVSMIIDDRGFSFSSPDVDIWSPHIGATLPPYEAVFGQANPTTTADATVREALAAFNAMSTVSDRTKLSLRGGLHFYAQGKSEIAEDEISCDVKGAGGTVYLATQLILDALKAAPKDRVTIGIAGELDPILVTSGCMRTVIMPLRPGFES